MKKKNKSAAMAAIKSLYGYEKPIVGATFPSTPILRHFLQDYNALVHSQKKIRVKNYSNSFHYYCHDQPHCSWNIRARNYPCKKKKNNRNNELIVIKITHVHNVHSKDCTSKVGPTQYDNSLKRTATVVNESMMENDDDDDDDDDDNDNEEEENRKEQSELEERRQEEEDHAIATVPQQQNQQQQQQPSVSTDHFNALLRDVVASEQRNQTKTTTIDEGEQQQQQVEDHHNNNTPQQPQQEQELQPDNIMTLLRSIQHNLRQMQTEMTYRWQCHDAIEYNRRYVRCGTDPLRIVPNEHGLEPSWFPKTLNELLFASLARYETLLQFYNIPQKDTLVHPEQKRTAIRRHLGLPY